MNLPYDKENRKKIYSQSLINCNDLSIEFNDYFKKLED